MLPIGKLHLLGEGGKGDNRQKGDSGGTKDHGKLREIDNPPCLAAKRERRPMAREHENGARKGAPSETCNIRGSGRKPLTALP
ncbi:hypothetical protein GCM10011324_26770 [Allosediminivita pacifica]|nr:hypothetical protein GCM10011324_26770 [Allosediminivita pacifica]